MKKLFDGSNNCGLSAEEFWVLGPHRIRLTVEMRNPSAPPEDIFADVCWAVWEGGFKTVECFRCGMYDDARDCLERYRDELIGKAVQFLDGLE